MARKPRKSAVRDIAKNLLESEIPEIRTIAKELAECTKLLEEHSQKLQNYASEIQSLAAEEAGVSVEASLTERLRDLERTLAELSQGAKGAVIEPEVGGEVGEKVDEEPGEAPALGPRLVTYTTPEGFAVRRRRY